MNQRGVATPVLLGGAALTRAYVERDLREIYSGDVSYARDAFEGLRLMDAVMGAKRGLGSVPSAAVVRTPAHAASERPAPRRRLPEVDEASLPARSAVATDVPVPAVPFFGSRVVKGIALADYASYLDERATFMGQWGLRGSRGGKGPSYEELVETEGKPRLRDWLARIQSEGIMNAAVVYGYFPCVSKGDDLIVLSEDGTERVRFTFPRQRRDRRLCISDFFRSDESGETDVVAFHVVTMGEHVSEVTHELFERNAYREYLELNGLSVQLTEALAEMWHARIREEMGLAGEDSPDLGEIFRQAYRGSRYSFGYPACPNLEDQTKIVTLLEPERIGVTLSEEFQLHPEQSTSAIIVHHPEAKYFAAR
jgi:5-methyltetrahydrofolate--homocysteine methyltransferase